MAVKIPAPSVTAVVMKRTSRLPLPAGWRDADALYLSLKDPSGETLWTWSWSWKPLGEIAVVMVTGLAILSIIRIRKGRAGA